LTEEFGGSWSGSSRVDCCVEKVQLAHLVQIIEGGTRVLWNGGL